MEIGLVGVSLDQDFGLHLRINSNAIDGLSAERRKVLLKFCEDLADQVGNMIR